MSFKSRYGRFAPKINKNGAHLTLKFGVLQVDLDMAHPHCILFTQKPTFRDFPQLIRLLIN